MPKTTQFDAADYLETEERQVAYVTAARETGDANFVRDALGIVARARKPRDRPPTKTRLGLRRL